MIKINRKYPKILKRFIFSYSIIIILPLLVGIVSYKESVNIISKDSRNYNITMLHQSMEMMDRIFAEADRISYQISVNPQVIKFCYLDDFNDTSIYYSMWETLSYIKPYSSFNEAGLEYNIYFHKSDMVFNSNGTFRLLEYYKNFYYENIDLDQFRKTYLNIISNGVFMPAKTINTTEITMTGKKISKSNVITYLKSIPTMSNSILNTTIFLQIKEEIILNLLNGLDVSDNGFVYVLDENSQIITSISRSVSDVSPEQINFKGNEGSIKKNINGKSMYITYTISSYNGWKYVYAMPSNIVMAKVDSIRNLILGVTCASLFLGIILLVLLAYANSKPIIELKKILIDFFNAEDDNKNGEFSFLKNSITILINQSALMKNDIKRQRTTLHKSIIERLLLGKNINEDFVEMATQSGIKLDAKSYTCVVIKVKDLNLYSNKLQELDMEQIIHSQTGQKGYLIDVDKTTLCLLLCFSTQQIEVCKQYVETVIKWLDYQIMNSFNSSPTFVIGSIYMEINNIYRSYNEAKQALIFTPSESPSKILWYSNLEMDTSSNYFYPPELEQRLIHLVKHGYKYDVSSLLTSILEKNMENPQFLIKSQTLLRNEIYGTIYKLSTDKAENIISELERIESLTDVFKYLQTLLNDLCDEVNKQKNNHNIDLVDKIISHLESYYFDSNVSLSQVAVKFNFSEGYISQLFKDRTGEQFAIYLERIRLNHACELLEKNTYTIKEVASKTGYNSPQSFRRAFKRVKGYNPTDFTSDDSIEGV